MTEVEELKEAHAKEIRELKQKVTQVAKRYATTYNWCEVVDQALSEMGMGPDWQRVEVTLNVATVLQLDIDVNELSAMSEAEQHAYIKEQLDLGITTSPKPSVRNVAVVERDEQVIEIGEPTPPPPGAVNPPVGAVARYTSTEGRVLHYVRTYQGHQLMSTAICGSGPGYYTIWTERSDRAETTAEGTPRVCARCTERRDQ
jgi:hypothetical protein